MGSFTLNLKNYIKSLVYDKDEIDTALAGKAAATHEHGDLYYTESETDTLLNGKVDKVNGKGLSTEDYTTAEKNKLSNIEAQANKTIVDSALDSSSENPVQNKAVQTALSGKVDKVNGKGLSTEDFTTAEKTKLAGLANTTVDSSLSPSSTNPVQNKVVKSALDGKAASSHTHAASEVTDSSAYANLETSAGATQAAINSAINTKIGSLLSVELITVVQSLPTAAAGTMNKMYLIAESSGKTNDNYEIFITVRSGTSGNYTYAWEKVDTARLDLSGYMQTANFQPAFDTTTGILTIDY